MKKYIFISGIFLSLNVLADDHMATKKNTKEKFMENPNYIMSFKDCKETKDGILGLLALNESIWNEIEKDPENDEKWLEVSIVADLAANYSTIYDVFCKDMINHRMKLRMMSDKKKKNKDKKDD